jgi:hypothetical protein
MERVRKDMANEGMQVLAAFREMTNNKNLSDLELHDLIRDGIMAALARRYGLNVEAVTDAEERALVFGGFYGGRMIGEGLLYTVVEPPEEIESLCVRYTGAYPVYRVDEGEGSTHDFKGVIAFNGRTLRATEQSKWYPVLYDPSTGNCSRTSAIGFIFHARTVARSTSTARLRSPARRRS